MKKKIKLKEMLDITSIQSLMDDFYSLTGMGIGIIDAEGEILVATGWQEVCTLYHRQNISSRKYCLESDLFLTTNVKKGEFLEYKCMNNLRDIVTPIYVQDEHVGNIFFGQFFYEDEEIDLTFFENQAGFYGFDKIRYLDSLKRVPRFSRTRVNTAIQFYSKFALIISSLLNSNLELQQALEENKKVIINLRRSNNDLERFAYISSHDLKEPLRMISSYVQLFLYNYENKFDESGKKYAGFIVEGVKRMYQLIEDLVKYSYLLKPVSDSFEIIDCDKLLLDVLTDLSILILENNATVHVDPLTHIYANPTQLRLLFQNLIENAIKFRSDSSPDIFISFADLPDRWQFSISDNGIGIDSKHSETIFDLFSRLNSREKYDGSGIGLAECRRVVENHGGRIWVESEAGKGSVFRFSIKKGL